VNRLCGSGLQAINSAAHAIAAGDGDVFVAGGVESMTRAPYVMLKTAEPFPRTAPPFADSTLGWRFVNPALRPAWTVSLGETAEVVGGLHRISREDQDGFALESQRRAAAATRDGVFADEIVPVEVPAGTGARGHGGIVVDRDEHPRPETTLESLRKLKAAFRREGGTVTAGSSSGINDGAAALLVMDRAAALSGGFRPLARIVASAVVGVDPQVMGIGPVPAVRKAAERAGIAVRDLDLIELNEAFAAQALACIRELELDPARVNVYGGAIALGHPLGATGARMLTTLVHALKRRKARYACATMCIGVGQGIAMIVEREDTGR